MPDAYSFIKTDSDHVVLYALKQMEGFYDTDAIARFVECEGREGDVTIQLPRVVRATETTLLEDVAWGRWEKGQHSVPHEAMGDQNPASHKAVVASLQLLSR